MKTIELEKCCIGCVGCGYYLKIGFIDRCPCKECLVKPMCKMACPLFRTRADEYCRCIRQQILKTKEKGGFR